MTEITIKEYTEIEKRDNSHRTISRKIGDVKNYKLHTFRTTKHPRSDEEDSALPHYVTEIVCEYENNYTVGRHDDFYEKEIDKDNYLPEFQLNLNLKALSRHFWALKILKEDGHRELTNIFERANESDR
jgi:hypothetical protein